MRNLLRYLVVYILLVSIFFGSLVLVSAMPRRGLDYNIYDSVNMLNKEGLYSRQLYHTSSLSKLDNYTDVTMLNIIYHLSNDNVINSALAGNMLNEKETHIFKTLQFASLEHSVNPNMKYSRYWHGYLIFLKPLFTFFNISEIRIINQYIFVFLLFTCLALICRKIDYKTAFAFLFSIIIMNLFIITVSLQFITDFYILIIASILVLILPKKYYKNLPLIFFIIGAITMFFDFYTYPILTFGYPMVCILGLMYKQDEKYKTTQSIKFIFTYFFTWITGYLSVWIGKAILNYFIIGPEELNVLIYSVKGRLTREYDGVTGSTLWQAGMSKSFGVYRTQ